jgi:formate dehydrogenase assembly factor FdhD
MRAKSLQRQGKTLDAATVSASTKPAFQANSFDPFDVVIGHLLDEGYADTEEAALAIMANMSEEWRQSIVESDSIEAMRERAAKRRKQRYGASDTSRGGRDDFRPYTEDDYKRPGPGSQAKEA